MGQYKESRVPRDKQKHSKWPVAIDKELEAKLLRLCEELDLNKSEILRKALQELADKYLNV